MTSKTKKVVINKCYGGFSLSHAGMMRWAELKGIELYGYVGIRDNRFKSTGQYELYDPKKHDEKNLLCIHYTNKLLETPNDSELNKYYRNIDVERDDPCLVQLVKEMGKKASGSCTKLEIVEIPADVNFVIEEYDGMESIAETHRTWG